MQASACAPLAAAFDAGSDQPEPVTPGGTLAEGIAIAEPVRGPDVLAAVRETDGCFLRVSEDDTADALRDVGRQGLYIEPTAAATLAGVRAYCAAAPAGSTIVTALTGSGLKSTGKMQQLVL